MNVFRCLPHMLLYIEIHRSHGYNKDIRSKYLLKFNDLLKSILHDTELNKEEKGEKDGRE